MTFRGSWTKLSKAIDAGTRRIIAEIISRRLDATDVIAFDAVVTAASSDRDLQTAIEPLVAPILLNTQRRRMISFLSDPCSDVRTHYGCTPRDVLWNRALAQNTSETAGHPDGWPGQSCHPELRSLVFCLSENYVAAVGRPRPPTLPL